MGGLIVVAGTDDMSGGGICARLRARGYRAEHQARARGLVERVQISCPELAVLSLPLGESSAGSVVKRLRQVEPGLKVIVAGPGHLLDAGTLMTEGAFDCVADPADQPDRLLAAVGYALGARREDRELEYMRSRESDAVQLDRLIGNDVSMRRVFRFVRQVVRRTANGTPPMILLTGETGTGKGALAKCIHYQSTRRNRPFVEVNCAAIPSNLIESELFGHERGAFTDARRARAGLFETADGGTLFLDEIASMPFDVQAKLLIAIEERRFRRIGGRNAMTVDIQLIAASQPVLKRMVKDGTFREDLYHRLNVLSVSLPPLRDRGYDRLDLAERFLEELCGAYGMPKRELSDGARKFIQRYHWPGNVRELRNQVERIVLLSDEPVIEAWQFERASGDFLRIDPDTGKHVRIQLPSAGLDLAELEKEVIRQALELKDGNVSATARYLGISRQTLIYRLKKHNLRN